jgi:hypothetical protein
MFVGYLVLLVDFFPFTAAFPLTALLFVGFSFVPRAMHEATGV